MDNLYHAKERAEHEAGGGFCVGHREQNKYTLTDLALILIISE